MWPSDNDKLVGKFVALVQNIHILLLSYRWLTSDRCPVKRTRSAFSVSRTYRIEHLAHSNIYVTFLALQSAVAFRRNSLLVHGGAVKCDACFHMRARFTSWLVTPIFSFITRTFSWMVWSRSYLKRSEVRWTSINDDRWFRESSGWKVRTKMRNLLVLSAWSVS